MSATSILAIGFVTPAFFAAGLALASIPIIIHILNRRRYRIVDWAAMTFLLQALRKNRRRLRFEQWLLLAVRCCVLLFLGLALSRPLGCQDSTLANLAARRAGLHVLVIDNSYSMAYEADRPDAKTHLDQAKLLAKRMIDRLAAGGEAVAVITSARPATAVIAQPTYDLQAAKLAIDRIDQSWGGTDTLGALTKALEIGREASSQPNRRLYLFTDATRSAWESKEAEAMQSLGRDLDRVYEIVHFNLSKPGQWNHAVLDVKPSRDLVRSGFTNLLTSTVRGFGGTGSEALVQWKLDDQPLPGGGSIKPALDTPPLTQSQSQIKEGGPHVITVSLAGDNRLKVDDTRSRVIDVASELKVLIVEGERGVGPMAGSGAFLNIALAPPSDEGTHTTGSRFRTSSYVSPELISDLEFGSKVLGDYRAVILAGVPQISPHQADQIKTFVEQGGTLLMFMGEPVSGDNYNQVLLPRGLVPGALAKRVSAPVGGDSYGFDFNPNGNLHPYLSIFRGVVDSGIDKTQVFTYWQVELPPGAKAQRVLDFKPDEKGRHDPAITVHDLGQGRVVFVATTANADWTTFPAKPAYLPLIHELLAGSVSAGDRWLNLDVNQSLEIPPTVQLTATPALKDPQQGDVVMDQVQTQSASHYRSRPLTKPGIYSLSTGARRIPVVVNVPDDEADIRPLDNNAIRQALGNIDVSLADDQLPELATQTAGNDFGWSFMLVVLGLVGLECFLAMTFGHYRR